MKPNATQLEAFRDTLTKAIQEKEAQDFPNSKTETAVLLEPGKRYVRIVTVKTDKATGELLEHTRSAYGFIDIENGDLLKASGWKAPAKGARGNIFNENPLDGCGQFGMEYKRGGNYFNLNLTDKK